MRRLLLPVVVALGLLAGCGGHRDAGRSPVATPTPTASQPVPPHPPSASLPTAVVPSGPNPGLPTDFPSAVVPLVPGQVALPVGQGGGAAGHKGWVLELRLAKASGACFDAAAKALTDDGFVRQPGETNAHGLHEAQFLAPGYAVIISVSRAGDGRCRLGYEVGQVGQVGQGP